MKIDAHQNVPHGSKNTPHATLPDICRVANAMTRKPLQFASYTGNGGHKPIGWPEHIPHVSSIICDRTTNAPRSSSTPSWTKATPSVRSIFSFKSARSGSTFFTSVVTEVLREAGRPTTKYWEPSFCSNLKQHSHGLYREAEFQARSLRKLLTSKCNMGRGGCKPARVCREEVTEKPGKDPVYVVAMNPRFLNQSIDWDDAVSGLGDTLRIFSLRRTNLVLMAYSKFHHGGCRIDRTIEDVDYYSADRRRLDDDAGMGTDNVMQKENHRRKRRRKGNQSFTFQTMLRCIHHYTIGDQELSISSAFAASVASKSSVDPYLILYEDVLSSGNIVQEGLLQHLGLAAETSHASSIDISSTGNVFESNSTKKLHSDPLCHYNDVNCTELEYNLQYKNEKKYPCLWKQYQRAEEGLTWSMPLLSNGSVSLEGDCFPLEPLNKKRRIRTVDETYRLPRK